MAKGCTVFKALIFIAVISMTTSACLHRSPKEEGSGFKDDAAMRTALRGSWILQEYADSIDAGLTPKLLEYILEREHSIEYYPGAAEGAVTTGAPDKVRVGYQENNTEKTLTVRFDPKANKITFLEPIDLKQSAISYKEVAHAEFLIINRDTNLLFYNDSTPGKPIEFTKYDMNRCDHVPAYLHLVSSRFIAGKYYAADDKDRSHHIIFTKCQNIEGAENISTDFKSSSMYQVELGQFGADGDKIRFMDKEDKGKAEMVWSVDKDSLILFPYSDRSKPIVLLKAK